MKRSFWHFISSHKKAPPAQGDQLMHFVQDGLRQETRHAHAKFALALTCACAASLFLCPQFGLGRETILFHYGHQLMNAWGAWACATYCSFLFMGLTSFLATLIMRPNEILLLGRRSFFFFSVLGAAGFGALMMARSLGLGSDFLTHSKDFSYVITWAVAGILMAQAAHHTAGHLRLWFARHLQH